jgi:hypothetical protein
MKIADAVSSCPAMRSGSGGQIPGKEIVERAWHIPLYTFKAPIAVSLIPAIGDGPGRFLEPVLAKAEAPYRGSASFIALVFMLHHSDIGDQA